MKAVDKNKFKGGIFGLLIGDALGVPYEFCKPEEISNIDKIEYEPPEGFEKSYDVPSGTWSDDGAQALCLLESLITKKLFDIYDFAERLRKWADEGLWAVDNIVFDIGSQTRSALLSYERGESPLKSGLIYPNGKGNGALMRVLPLALWHKGTDKELVKDAHKQCLITHGHICNQVCCAFYCLVVRELLYNNSFFQSAYENALAKIRTIYSDTPEYKQELELNIFSHDIIEGKGTGYVVDCLKSAFMVINQSNSYEEVVKKAISLGNDTDTTAAVAGGLAGVIYGYKNIPTRWINGLRNKEAVEILLESYKIYE